MRIVYLHGFASSPQSSKAQFFAAKFCEAGVPFEAPELDGGDFERLTVSGQLAVIERAVGDGGPGTVLMGSSLGGYLAALYAATHPASVERVILLAPAFNFLARWKMRLSPEQLMEWQTRGWVPIFHYGSKSERRLSYRFLEDGARHPAVPGFSHPALILHGTEDLVVPAEGSREFVRDNPNAKLILYTSGHELTDVVDPMWQEVARFLALA